MYRILTLFVVVTMMNVQLLSAGGRENGGGHWLATEFRERARFVIHLLEKEVILSKAQIEQLIASVADTRIEMTQEDLRDEFGGPAKAVTTDDPQRPGKKLIRVKEAEWQALLSGSSPGNSIGIVFHEYLRSIAIPDYNEFTSSQLKATEDDYLAWIKNNRRAEENTIVLPIEVKGDLVEFGPNEADHENKLRALASYAEYSREWRLNIEQKIRDEIGDTIGIRGFLIEKSGGIQDRHMVSIETGRLIWEPYDWDQSRANAERLQNLERWKKDVLDGRWREKSIRVGHRGMFVEDVRVYLERDRTLLKSRNIRLQSPIQYWNSNYKTEAEGREHFKITYDRIHHDFEKTCEEWKSSVRENFRVSWDIVFLDCGVPTMVGDDSQLRVDDIIEVQLATSPKRYRYYARLQGYRLESKASIYYLQK